MFAVDCPTERAAFRRVISIRDAGLTYLPFLTVGQVVTFRLLRCSGRPAYDLQLESSQLGL